VGFKKQIFVSSTLFFSKIGAIPVPTYGTVSPRIDQEPSRYLMRYRQTGYYRQLTLISSAIEQIFEELYLVYFWS
jgi:hypothetical protein